MKIAKNISGIAKNIQNHSTQPNNQNFTKRPTTSDFAKKNKTSSKKG